ncbi:transmembrane protein 182 [Hoplias malabaricus]|uniref:transmembrane protein 182 n=1 Tax=Hoplias malabaricus TaxID=27720 RepID=UPI003462119A
MRPAVLRFMAGFCGALGTIFLLLSLGTDYWLLAFESCDPGVKENSARLKRVTTEEELQEERSGTEILSYHEGIFWRCSYRKEKNKEEKEEAVLDFWITNQPSEKVCMPAYLPQVPLSGILISDSTSVYRAFWGITSVLGLTMVLLGVFFSICGIPTASRRLYEAGGALCITGGLLFFVVVGTFMAWVQGSSSLEQYVLQRRLSACPSLCLHVYYGPSFMLAPVASFFCLLCGLLILLPQTTSKVGSKSSTQEPCPVDGWQVSTL